MKSNINVLRNKIITQIKENLDKEVIYQDP